MDFRRSRNFYLVTRITGPTHNLLIVRLEDTDVEVQPTIRLVPAMGNCQCGPPDQAAVLSNVLTGINEANLECGTNYKIAEIHIVENDLKSEIAYRIMMRALIKHIESNEEFAPSNYGD
jgi:hypothetical protein